MAHQFGFTTWNYTDKLLYAPNCTQDVKQFNANSLQANHLDHLYSLTLYGNLF